jgi:hypothetical protein
MSFVVALFRVISHNDWEVSKKINPLLRISLPPTVSPYEALISLCCLIQNQEARALGDLASRRLNFFPGNIFDNS